MPLDIKISKNKLENQLNKIYGQNDITASAVTMLKETVNIGEAIINILGNTGIAGFKFHIPEEEQIRLQSDITDHYTDKNRPIQDHIARKPVRITLRGLCGEYFYSVNRLEDTIAKVVPTLSLVKQFLPKISESMKQGLIKKHEIVNVTDKNGEYSNGVLVVGVEKKKYKWEFNGTDIFSLFQEIYKLKSAQTRAYFFFEALWMSQATFSVETSWKRFNNMVIESVTPHRRDNADNTEFTIVVKQLDFAETRTDTVENVVARMKEMLGKTVNKGVDKGKEVATI